VFKRFIGFSWQQFVKRSPALPHVIEQVEENYQSYS